MDRVPEALHLPVEIERRGPCPFKSEPLQKLDLLLGNAVTQGTVVEEIRETGLQLEHRPVVAFHELESLGSSRAQSAIQPDLDAEGREVDVPGLDHLRNSRLLRDVREEPAIW
jgi:hypothetical protein